MQGSQIGSLTSTSRICGCTFKSTITEKPSRRKTTRANSTRADDGFCRDKINAPLDKPAVAIEGQSTISFLGAKGQEIPVTCDKRSYILDAGLDAGLELPFTCRGGICGACVGRVVEGQVDQSDIADLSFTLSEDEIANGMTLICMSRPVSDVVKIETQSDWGYALGIAEWQGATGELTGKKVDPLMGEKWDEFQKKS